jgi:hypothetical protein
MVARKSSKQAIFSSVDWAARYRFSASRHSGGRLVGMAILAYEFPTAPEVNFFFRISSFFTRDSNVFGLIPEILAAPFRR